MDTAQDSGLQAIPLLVSKPHKHTFISQPGMHPQTKLFSLAFVSLSRERPLFPSPGSLVAPWGKSLCRPHFPDSAPAQPAHAWRVPSGQTKDWPEGAEPTERPGLTRCPISALRVCTSACMCMCKRTHTPAQWLHLFRGTEGSTDFAVTLAPKRRHNHPSHSSPAAPSCSHPVTLSDRHSKGTTTPISIWSPSPQVTVPSQG